MLFSQLFSVKAMLCTVQGIHSCAKGSIDWREREIENYGAAVATVWSSVCLSSLISAGPVMGHIVFRKQKPVPFYLPIHCWQWELDSTPGFLLLTPLLSSLPSWGDRADPGTCSSPSQGLHRKNVVDVLDILAQTPESYRRATANHISTFNQNPTLRRSCPAVLQLAEWKKC